MISLEIVGLIVFFFVVGFLIYARAKEKKKVKK